MTLTLYKPTYAQEIAAPTSKSAAHRLLIAAALADTETTLFLRTVCDDTEKTADCLRALGAKITPITGGLHVRPVNRAALCKNPLLDCGESGSTLRFLLPVVAALGTGATFIRRGRLPARPLAPLDSLLQEKGAALTEDGALLTVAGGITAGEYSIAANISSQYISGLLFALSLLDAPSTLTLTGEIESAPYIDMTLDTLRTFGAEPARQTARCFCVSGSARPLKSPKTVTVEGDFSGAAFPLAIGAVGSHSVTVTGLRQETKQGDAKILDLLARFGAEVQVTKDAVTVSPAPLHGIQIDATDIPDLVPILAVVAAAAQGETVITGAARLRLKESDRIATTAAMLRAVGAAVTVTDDGLRICGGKPLKGSTVDAAGDHRIAMSAAVLSLLTEGALTLTGAETVSKSYPTFFKEVFLQ